MEKNGTESGKMVIEYAEECKGRGKRFKWGASADILSIHMFRGPSILDGLCMPPFYFFAFPFSTGLLQYVDRVLYNKPP